MKISASYTTQRDSILGLAVESLALIEADVIEGWLMVVHCPLSNDLEQAA